MGNSARNNGCGSSCSDRLPFGNALSLAARARLDVSAARVSVPEGTTLHVEDQPCEVVIFVECGDIRVSKHADPGHELTLYHVGPGEVCALSVASVLGRHSFGATAKVVAPLVGYRVRAAALRQMVATEPALQRFVIRLMAERLVHVAETVIENRFEPLDRRLARFLARRHEGGAVALTHEKIALELGTAREVVTRLLDSFQSSGLVERGRGNVVITDPAGLRDLARGEADTGGRAPPDDGADRKKDHSYPEKSS